MDSRPLIKDSLQILSFVSLNPLSTNLMNRFFGICAVVIVMVTFADNCLYLTFNYQGIIDSTMEIFFTIGFSQHVLKALFLMTCREKLKLLINKISMFWKPKLDEFEQQQKENNKIFLYVKYSIQFYTVFFLLFASLFLIKPLFFTAVGELWKTCFSKFFSYKICYMIEIIPSLTCCFMLLGFDTLYISLITNIICEFKLLENRFPNLKINPSVRGTDEEAMTELKTLIEHHILILECVKMMKHVYKTPMLCLFLVHIFVISFSLIVITSSTSNNATKMVFGTMVIFYYIQLFYYCICGSMLADESEKISIQAYKSKWWIKTQPELRKTLMMVILRANKPEMLTAGGLFDINLETYKMILSNSYSFFTFMQVMYDKSE